MALPLIAGLIGRLVGSAFEGSRSKKPKKSIREYREEALKAQQIVKSTFRVDKKNTQYVYPMKMDVTNRGYKFQTVTKIPKQRARVHVVQVQMPRGYKGKFNACDAIKVDCDCERYMFVWNYALNKKGSAIKDRTNGEAPVVTNPNLAPGVCKHGLVMLSALSKLNPEWPANRATRGDMSGRLVRLASIRDVLR